MNKKKIILVDDSPANLTACKKTLKDVYDVYPAPSAEKMFDTLRHVIPNLILLDVEMPVTNGYEAMRMLKQNDEYKDIPVVFLSAMDDARSEMEGLELGAVDYIHKPFVSALLIKRIETNIELIDGKRELQTLNKSVEYLLRQITETVKTRAETEDDAIRELLIKVEFLSRMGHEILAPLNSIIGMTEAAENSGDAEEIRRSAAAAGAEAKRALEIVRNALELPENG